MDCRVLEGRLSIRVEPSQKVLSIPKQQQFIMKLGFVAQTTQWHITVAFGTLSMEQIIT
jgi:hypothetical protein